jgi:tRNA pseudouridine55 synthase
MFGFLNIYKPQGKTSHDVVAILRRITKVKQIGHTGTLDPFAEGVLPICIGKATRLIEYLDDDKAYIGTIQLGKSTTTYDIEGDFVDVSDKRVSLDEIEKALPKFRGEIEQLPTIYSAIKVNGKKLYEYARNGEDVKIEPRRVTIQKLEIVNFDENKQTLELHIECSKGTYIRSIANDLGEALGAFGHLVKLVRVKAGFFELDTTVDLETLDLELVKNNLLEPLKVLNYSKKEISERELSLVKNGMKLFAEGFNEGEFVLLTYESNLVSVACFENGCLVQKKVFM